MAVKEFKQIVEELDSGSIFFGSDYEAGFSDAKAMMLKALDKTAEPVGISDRLTLTELAYELRKILKFGYLTLDAVDDGDCAYPDMITLWVDEPYYESSDKQFELQWNYDKKSGAIIMIPISSLQIDINLSEYKDEYGDIDYSKCIVEVEE